MSRLALVPYYFMLIIFVVMMVKGAYEQGVSGLFCLALIVVFALAASKN